MSDSKQAIKVLGGQGTSPDVINSAPAGTEKGWAVWVVNPGAGGGTSDQGKAGTSGESWYVRDGSGLLSTAAKQDVGNSSLASIDGKLTGPLSVVGPLTNTQLRAAAVPVSVASIPLASGAATEAKQDGQISLATTGNASLASIDGKVATAANQATANASLSSILAQLDSKTSVLATQATAASILGQLDAKTSALATASGQATANASLSSIDSKLTNPLPVSGTVAVTGVATAANQTNGSQVTQISGSVAVTGPLTDAQLRATPVPVSATITPSGTQDVNLTKVGGNAVTTTVPISGTLTANIGTTNGLALDATLAKLTVAQGAALGTNTLALLGASVSASAPSYADGTIQPPSLTTAGALRVSAVGNVVTPVSQSITTNDTSSTSTAGQSGQNIITGTATAGSTAEFALLGAATVGATISNVWSGTLVPEISRDNRATWAAIGEHVTGTAVNSAAWTANGTGNLPTAGATHFRFRSTTAWTGTATITVVEAAQASSVYVANAIRITNSTGIQADTTAASTAAVGTQPGLVVSLSPNSRLAESNTIGAAVPSRALYIGGIDAGGNIQAIGLAADNTALGSPQSLGKVLTLPALASTAAPSWTTNRPVPLSTNLAGSLRTLPSGSTTPADATANPTTAQLAFSLLGGWNGTTWDRVQCEGYVDGDNAPARGLLGTEAYLVAYNGTTVDRLRTAGTTTGSLRVLPHDGTNGAAIKAASTAAVATDPALVVAVSPNNTIPIRGAGTAGIADSGVVTVQGIGSGTPINVAQTTPSALKATTFPGGSSSYNTNGATETRTVRTGAGVLRGLIINPGAGGSIVVYDNTAASGTVLAPLTILAGGQGYFVNCFDATFSTGLTYVTTGTPNVTLVYYF